MVWLKARRNRFDMCESSVAIAIRYLDELAASQPTSIALTTRKERIVSSIAPSSERPCCQSPPLGTSIHVSLPKRREVTSNLAGTQQIPAQLSSSQ